jgi:hypothetical protein
MANGDPTPTFAFGTLGALLGGGVQGFRQFKRSKSSRRRRRRFRQDLFRSRKQAERISREAVAPGTLLGQQQDFLRRTFSENSPFIGRIQAGVRAQQAAAGTFGTGNLAAQQEAIQSSGQLQSFRGGLLGDLQESAFAPERLRQQVEAQGGRELGLRQDQNAAFFQGRAVESGAPALQAQAGALETFAPDQPLDRLSRQGAQLAQSIRGQAGNVEAQRQRQLFANVKGVAEAGNTQLASRLFAAQDAGLAPQFELGGAFDTGRGQVAQGQQAVDQQIASTDINAIFESQVRERFRQQSAQTAEQQGFLRQMILANQLSQGGTLGQRQTQQVQNLGGLAAQEARRRGQLAGQQPQAPPRPSVQQIQNFETQRDAAREAFFTRRRRNAQSFFRQLNQPTRNQRR